MKVSFNLKLPKSKTPTVIICSVCYSMKRLRIFTGISVEPGHWNKNTNRVRQTPSFREGSAINTRLDKIQSEINKCYYDYLNDNNAEPSPDTLRKLIDVTMGRSKEVKLNFFEYFKDFINRTRAGQRQTAKGKLISPYKGKTYGTTYSKLKEFRPRLDFENIDIDFYNDFTTWLRKQGYAENYVGGHIKNLKSVLSEATERGLNTNLAFRSKRFIKVTEEVNNIALTESELEEIYHLHLSNSPHLEHVRDLFLIGCYTGLRFGDLSRLNNENIKGNFIEVTQSKTGSPVVIPEHHVVKSIIKKYKGSLPKSISNQKYNGYLKEIMKQVKGLTVKANRTRTQGGMKLTTNYPKWEMITSHTARRTFATNAYLQHIPTITIMAITGHKTEKAFLKYIKVTPKEHAKIMAAFWNKNKMKVV